MAQGLATQATPPRPSRGELGRQLEDLQPRLTAVARRFSQEGAEDIVQNAFEKAWQRFHQFDGRARLSTWMHRIVVNEALMWLRSERRRARHQLDIAAFTDRSACQVPDAGSLLEKHRSEAGLRAAIAALSAPDREVLQACVLDERPYQEYCAQAGIGPAAAKSRAFRARQRLREILSEA